MARPRRFDSNEEVEKAPINKENLKQALMLFRYLLPYKSTFGAALFFLFLSNVTTMLFPFITGKLVDAARIGSGESIGAAINQYAFLLIGILAFQAVFSFGRIYLFSRVAEFSLADIRRDTYSRLISLPMNFFANRRVGELSSRLSADLTQIQGTLSSSLAEFIRLLLTLIIGISFILYISWKLTLVMISVFPVLIAVAVLFGKHVRKLSREAQDQLAESGTVVEETLQGITNVKAFTAEHYEVKRYGDHLKKAVTLGIKSSVFQGSFASFIIFGLFGAIVLVMWQGSRLMAEGELSAGSFISFMMFTIFVGGSMGGFAEVYNQLQRTIGATQRVRELLNETPEAVSDTAGPIEEQYILKGNVSFREVAFRYPSRKEVEVLKAISFEAEAGKKIALVGPSGAGKSTMVSLLLRLYEPDAGTILFDRHDCKQIPLTQLRRQMAYVPQDVILFGGTILDNIRYGKPDASDDEIKSAAHKAYASEFIESFPDKYQTIVGERGIKLSGGQRQRIAIARAILRNPRILILDEATSSLDSESERMVQLALEELMQGRTSFIIAHRLSTIRDADNILVLNNGIISEQGTHEQLLALPDGLYKKLNDIQFADTEH
ncbi:MAG: ABC transporter ATP-binding protein [Bacteroidota bacterium]